MTRRGDSDDLSVQSAGKFRAMVESVGVKRFAADMDLSTRQINRMLSGAQPNPVERIVRCLQSCDAEIGDETLEFICQETGGHFVKDVGSFDRSSSETLRRAADAVASAAEDRNAQVSEREVREAISALIALLGVVQQRPSEPREEHQPVVHTRPPARPTSPTSPT